jgi:hypothetical protein
MNLPGSVSENDVFSGIVPETTPTPQILAPPVVQKLPGNPFPHNPYDKTVFSSASLRIMNIAAPELTSFPPHFDAPQDVDAATWELSSSGTGLTLSASEAAKVAVTLPQWMQTALAAQVEKVVKGSQHATGSPRAQSSIDDNSGLDWG